MDRQQLQTDLDQFTQAYRQAREQVFRLEGAMQYAQQLLARLDEKAAEVSKE